MTQTSFRFTSKTDVLKELSAFPDIDIPPFISVAVSEWREDSERELARIRKFFASSKVAVRSSCRAEDSETASCAGAFLSILDVNPEDPVETEEAVNRVIASYGDARPDDQVLVQKMVENVAVTGVIMTRSITDGSLYYVINYDDESGRTDSVTGGANVSKTVYIYRNARMQDFDSPRLKSFIQLAQRLEEITGKNSLDIEFCLDRENVLHLLQVRPICAQKNWANKYMDPGNSIRQISDFVSRKSRPRDGLFGRKTILGIMPDWNPAEMIGVMPHPLDVSLYRRLITNAVWREARAEMGYRELPATDLMVLCAGRPYIDVRASFNSFLPANLDRITGEAVVNAWLERLESNPQYHDKIEFEVAQTCLDFCFDENLESRYPGLLTNGRKEEFRNALKNLTASSIGAAGSLSGAQERIVELQARQAAKSFGVESSLSNVPQLLEECRFLGTFPFSVLARHAFIAESLLRSAARRGALSNERVAQYKRSVKTISGDLSRDFQQVCDGVLDKGGFLRKYGHLRPGTYDITSPCYARRDNLFQDARSAFREEEARFVLAPGEKKALDALLAENGLGASAEELLAYARKAIAGREYAKFIFTRHLSNILEIIAAWGEENGFAREDLRWLPIESVLAFDYSVNSRSLRESCLEQIALAREEYQKNLGLKLGYLIRSEKDVFIVPQHRSAPNFIGSRTVQAPVVRLDASSSANADLSAKIVCIENADPGFDWIFTRGIAGLVTKFGGANSHMAIRCAEYGLPAAIGAGEKLFSEIAVSENAFLNPVNYILKAV